MKKAVLFFIIATLFLNIQGKSQILRQNGDLIRIDLATLSNIKRQIQNDPNGYAIAYKKLLKDADQMLKFGPVSVMEKKDVPPSGTKHDYMSIAPYWWPDSSKPNGVPYIRKDGEINPEVNNYSDKNYLPGLCENVYVLSIAYKLSGDSKYAKHAASLVKTWFLDTATSMNPNLNFGQSVKGVTDGRAEGLIDTRNFIFLIEGLEMLRGSVYWADEENKKMKHWFSDFLYWMNNSKVGKEELNAANNHGIWFDAQALAISIYVDSLEMAKKIVERASKQLDEEMNIDGSFPLELARTTSLHYSVFNLNAFFLVANLAEKIKNDFWNYKTASGKSLATAFNFLLPYIKNPSIWTYKQIKPFKTSDAYPVLYFGNIKYKCADCLEFIKNSEGERYKQSLYQFLEK